MRNECMRPLTHITFSPSPPFSPHLTFLFFSSFSLSSFPTIALFVLSGVWQMDATAHLCMLSSRAPAMAERVWNPAGGRSFGDYAARVASTAQLLYKLLAAQGAPPSPPRHGFVSLPDPNAQPGCLAGCNCT